MHNLTATYNRAIELWTSLRTQHPALSAPLLVHPTDEYARSRTRLMIVGQETLGWGEGLNSAESPEVLREKLQQGYRDFDLGANYKATPFWDASNQLYFGLNPSATSRAFIWTNLVKMDNARRRPGLEFESSISALNLLDAELAAFKPQVVVFFTGPRYDDLLLRTFAGATLTPVVKSLFRVEHPSLPIHSFRTYHPKYLRLSKQWSVLNEIVERSGFGLTEFGAVTPDV